MCSHTPARNARANTHTKHRATRLVTTPRIQGKGLFTCNHFKHIFVPHADNRSRSNVRCTRAYHTCENTLVPTASRVFLMCAMNVSSVTGAPSTAHTHTTSHTRLWLTGARTDMHRNIRNYTHGENNHNMQLSTPTLCTQCPLRLTLECVGHMMFIPAIMESPAEMLLARLAYPPGITPVTDLHAHMRQHKHI